MLFVGSFFRQGFRRASALQPMLQVIPVRRMKAEPFWKTGRPTNAELRNEAEKIAEKMLRQPEIERGMFDSVLEKFCDSKTPWRALDIVRRCRENGLQLRTRDYNMVMSAYEKLSHYRMVEEVYSELVTADLKPDIVTFNIRMESFLDCKNYGRVDDLLREITNRRLFFERQTYSIMLDLYDKTDRTEEMEKVFLELKEKKMLNGFHYNKIFQAYARRKDVEKLKKHLLEMESPKQHLAIQVWTPLARCFAAAGLVEELQKLVQILQSFQISWDDVFFEQVVSGLIEADLDKALLVFDALAKGYKFDVARSVYRLILALGQAGRKEEAAQLLGRLSGSDRENVLNKLLGTLDNTAPDYNEQVQALLAKMTDYSSYLNAKGIQALSRHYDGHELLSLCKKFPPRKETSYDALIEEIVRQVKYRRLPKSEIVLVIDVLNLAKKQKIALDRIYSSIFTVAIQSEDPGQPIEAWIDPSEKNEGEEIGPARGVLWSILRSKDIEAFTSWLLTKDQYRHNFNARSTLLKAWAHFGEKDLFEVHFSSFMESGMRITSRLAVEIMDILCKRQLGTQAVRVGLSVPKPYSHHMQAQLMAAALASNHQQTLNEVYAALDYHKEPRRPDYIQKTLQLLLEDYIKGESAKLTLLFLFDRRYRRGFEGYFHSICSKYLLDTNRVSMIDLYKKIPSSAQGHRCVRTLTVRFASHFLADRDNASLRLLHQMSLKKRLLFPLSCYRDLVSVAPDSSLVDFYYDCIRNNLKQNDISVAALQDIKAAYERFACTEKAAEVGRQIDVKLQKQKSQPHPDESKQEDVSMQQRVLYPITHRKLSWM